MREYISKEDLTGDQKNALNKISTWMDDPSNPYKTLAGYSGSGKTTTIDHVVRVATKEKKMNTLVTATTNQAVRVLRERVRHDKFMTIHKVLNIKPKRKGTKETFVPDDFNRFDSSVFDLIIIDESSMVSELMFSWIDKEIPSTTKILFCGDPAQLEPVEDSKISHCFDFNPEFLTEVVRHGDVISSKSRLVRSTSEFIPFMDLVHPPEIDEIDMDEIIEMVQGFRKDRYQCRMLCWTNDRVKEWNQILRMFDYGKEPEQAFNVGDIVIANKPCFDNDDHIIMNNSEEGIVQSYREDEDAHILEILLKNFDGADNVVAVKVLKDSYFKQYNDQLKDYAEAKNWNAYWAFKNSYSDIRHCYAMTTHTAQGSTFKNVILDRKDISKNWELGNRNQLTYVAMTRATDLVRLF